MSKICNECNDNQLDRVKGAIIRIEEALAAVRGCDKHTGDDFRAEALPLYLDVLQDEAQLLVLLIGNLNILEKTIYK